MREPKANEEILSLFSIGLGHNIFPIQSNDSHIKTYPFNGELLQGCTSMCARDRFRHLCLPCSFFVKIDGSMGNLKITLCHERKPRRASQLWDAFIAFDGTQLVRFVPRFRAIDRIFCFDNIPIESMVMCLCVCAHVAWRLKEVRVPTQHIELKRLTLCLYYYSI